MSLLYSLKNLATGNFPNVDKLYRVYMYDKNALTACSHTDNRQHEIKNVSVYRQINITNSYLGYLKFSNKTLLSQCDSRQKWVIDHNFSDRYPSNIEPKDSGWSKVNLQIFQFIVFQRTCIFGSSSGDFQTEYEWVKLGTTKYQPKYSQMNLIFQYLFQT